MRLACGRFRCCITEGVFCQRYLTAAGASCVSLGSKFTAGNTSVQRRTQHWDWLKTDGLNLPYNPEKFFHVFVHCAQFDTLIEHVDYLNEHCVCSNRFTVYRLSVLIREQLRSFACQVSCLRGKKCIFFDGVFGLSQAQTTCRSLIGNQREQKLTFISFRRLGTRGHDITWSNITTNVLQ